jgi:dihydroorotate dehydrogenase
LKTLSFLIINFNSDWHLFKINNQYLSDVIDCWLHDIRPALLNNNEANKKIYLKQNKFKNDKKCIKNLIDQCKFPNCNLSCPNITHPLTGLSITPLALFNYYDSINSS